MKILNTKAAVSVFFFVFFIKCVAYYYFSGNLGLFGGGNDADYYDSFARGFDNREYNLWPILLRFLNNMGVYNRNGISIILFTISSLFLPVLFSLIVTSQVKISLHKSRIFWNSLLLVILYPTLFFFTLDIYRDIFMYSVFLLAIYCLSEHFIVKNSFWFLSQYSIMFFLLSFLCFLLRGYLGFSLIFSYIIFRFFKFDEYFYTYLFLYFIALVFLFYLGVLDPLVQYRGVEGFSKGGSSLGIGFVGINGIEFLYLYIYSAIVQLFGLYFSNVKAVLAFLSESSFFIVCLVYVFRNRSLFSPFINYLLVFTVIYSTIWLVGNDNLGTAVRLRVFGYLSIYLSAAIIFFRKKYSHTQCQ